MKTLILTLAAVASIALAGCMSNAEFVAADKARGDALCKDRGGMAASEGWSFGYAPTRVYRCVDGTRA